jgi:hypothetical protein
VFNQWVRRPSSETNLSGGVFLTYGVTFLVAVAVEPGVWLFHKSLDKLARRAERFEEVLEKLEGLEADLRVSLDRRLRLTKRLVHELASGRGGGGRRRPDGPAPDFGQVISGLQREFDGGMERVEDVLSKVRGRWSDIGRVIAELKAQAGDGSPAPHEPASFTEGVAPEVRNEDNVPRGASQRP